MSVSSYGSLSVAPLVSVSTRSGDNPCLEDSTRFHETSWIYLPLVEPESQEDI